MIPQRLYIHPRFQSTANRATPSTRGNSAQSTLTCRRCLPLTKLTHRPEYGILLSVWQPYKEKHPPDAGQSHTRWAKLPRPTVCLNLEWYYECDFQHFKHTIHIDNPVDYFSGNVISWLSFLYTCTHARPSICTYTHMDTCIFCERCIKKKPQ